MKVVFLPQKIEFEMEPGMTVLEASGLAGVHIDGNCAGAGTCGKCKVRIAEGNNKNFSSEEEAKLSEKELNAGYRLACKFVPETDCVVEVPLIQGAANRKTKLVKLPSDFLGREDYKALPEGQNCYGVAFDIGTTTVVGMLCDLKTNEVVSIAALTNPQGVYGADVISRIMYAGESDDNLKNIHQVVIDCMNQMILGFMKTEQIAKEDIYEVTMVGNTTMSHLLIGIDPSSLAVAPFHPVFTKEKHGPASDLGINIRPEGTYYLMANIAGHVGSDITAGVIATEILNSGKVVLQIDIGTNGEIVLTGKGRSMACSTAAGPAFEGASIFQGMRAAAGAIEKVYVEDGDLKIKVIGNQKPVGICGSGIIDGVAVMVEQGFVEDSGRFAKPEALLKKGVSQALIDRFRTGENGKEFVLHYGDDGIDIVLLQKDIREVQLAKGAISAGILLMMQELDIGVNEIDLINIAGAFGSYIDIESAVTIGLLPKVERNKIESVGNAAGIGAAMALLSPDKRREAEHLAETIDHIELAACPNFQDEYVKAMGFNYSI